VPIDTLGIRIIGDDMFHIDAWREHESTLAAMAKRVQSFATGETLPGQRRVHGNVFPL
jgi:hypothetical protein